MIKSQKIYYDDKKKKKEDNVMFKKMKMRNKNYIE
jgi:hypothetical protein